MRGRDGLSDRGSRWRGAMSAEKRGQAARAKGGREAGRRKWLEWIAGALRVCCVALFVSLRCSSPVRDPWPLPCWLIVFPFPLPVAVLWPKQAQWADERRALRNGRPLRHDARTEQGATDTKCSAHTICAGALRFSPVVLSFGEPQDSGFSQQGSCLLQRPLARAAAQRHPATQGHRKTATKATTLRAARRHVHASAVIPAAHGTRQPTGTMSVQRRSTTQPCIEDEFEEDDATVEDIAELGSYTCCTLRTAVGLGCARTPPSPAAARMDGRRR
jgi:hypothetical protein